MTHAPRSMDVEAALQWAYREEAPKIERDGFGASRAGSGVHPMWRGAAMGGRVDNWNTDPGFPAAMGAPDPAALILIDAVEALEPEDLDLGDAAISYRLGGELDPHAAYTRALDTFRTVLIAKAKLRARPDASAAVDLEPVRSITGQITVFVTGPQTYETWTGEPVEVVHEYPVKPLRKGVYPTGAYSKLRAIPGCSAADVLRDRAEYAVWWAALAAIARKVAGRLGNLIVTGPAVEQRPWVDQPTPAPALIVRRSELPPIRATKAQPRRLARPTPAARHSEVRTIPPSEYVA